MNAKKLLGLVGLPVAVVAGLARRVSDEDMGDSVSVVIDAPVEKIWGIVTDVTNTKKIAAETLDAEWMDGATGPAVGVKFRGQVKRNGRGPAYWTECLIETCDVNEDFGFAVVGGDRRINTWRYQFEAVDGGVKVTESFALVGSPFTRAYWALAGGMRRPTNLRNMQTTLENIKREAEAA